eukprot:TRINITY_DN1002_c0_g2_i5.p1 TRINITY_DN1002_c0_g2~~TRINITY_DN1002_c0_g2_i5.p1  ORF type:complete len:344 (+),score=58.35 TRINITY_DN1002_c0_g2_i5:66-1097(+)
MCIRDRYMGELTDSEEEEEEQQPPPKEELTQNEEPKDEEQQKVAQPAAGSAKSERLCDFQLAILRRIHASPNPDIYLHISNFPKNFTALDIKQLFQGVKLKQIFFNKLNPRCDVLCSRNDAITIITEHSRKYANGYKVFIDYSFKNDELQPKKLPPLHRESLELHCSPKSAGHKVTGTSGKKSSFSKGPLYVTRKASECIPRAPDDVVPVFYPKPVSFQWKSPVPCEDSLPIQSITNFLEDERREKFKTRLGETFNRDRRNQDKGFFAWGKKDSCETLPVSEVRTVRSSISKDSMMGAEDRISPRQDMSPLSKEKRLSTNGESIQEKNGRNVFTLSDDDVSDN